MNFSDTHTVYIAYGISNLAGLLLLWTAVKRPGLAKILFFLLFAGAGWVNYTTSRSNPAVYLYYAHKSVPFYADFINGWFRRHITVFVSVIAIGQALIAIGLWLKGILFKFACIGIIVFLLAIAPLGIYAAFPFSLTVAAAAFILLRNNRDQLPESSN